MVRFCITPSVLVLVVFIYSLPSVSASWGFSQEETEVFEVVDDFKANFYEFLGIKQDATTSEIRRGYRKLSLVMHPDKNKTEGAEENFRMLVAIYEILKDKEKREIYDGVLLNGLPSAYLYVPKRMRKMSMIEVFSFVTIILTIGHYLCMVARYFEKRLALEERLPQFRKKAKKKNKNSTEVDDAIEAISAKLAPWPTFRDILPIALPRGIYNLITSIPSFYRHVKRQKEMQLKMQEEMKKQMEEELAHQQRVKEQREEAKRIRKENLKKKREEQEKLEERVEVVIPKWSGSSDFNGGGVVSQSIEELEAMYETDTDDSDESEYNTRKNKKSNKKTQQKEWTDEEQSQLCSLMVKFPGGTLDRWAVIAREMDRPIAMVTTKAKLAKSSIGKMGMKSTNNSDGGGAMVRQRRKQVTNFGDETKEQQQTATTNATCSAEDWDQKQQKFFEQALISFPKTAEERWTKIAECVPGKTKEECIARYRFLSSKVLQKRKVKS